MHARDGSTVQGYFYSINVSLVAAGKKGLDSGYVNISVMCPS